MAKTVTFPNQITVCALGQGTWRMGEDPGKESAEIRALQTGLDLGLHVIDTAEMYANGQSEMVVAKAIKGRRDEVFLVSKVLPSNASRQGVKVSCEASLRRLNTDYLDLYLLHWKSPFPFSETIDAMNALVSKGYIKQWGVSNMTVSDMQKIIETQGGECCATNQVLYNLSRRGIEHDLMPWMQAHRMPVMAYSPIEQGRLLHHPVIDDIAKKHQATIAQIALAWSIRLPGIVSIPKASTAEHVRENAAALSINLTQDDLQKLDQAFLPPDGPVDLEVL